MENIFLKLIGFLLGFIEKGIIILIQEILNSIGIFTVFLILIGFVVLGMNKPK